MNKILFKLLFTCFLLTTYTSPAMEAKEADATEVKAMEFTKNHTDHFIPADQEFFKAGGNKTLSVVSARFKFGYLKEFKCADGSGSISYRVILPNRYLLSGDKIGSVHIFIIKAPNKEIKKHLLDRALMDAWSMHATSKPVVYSGSDDYLKEAGFVESQDLLGKTIMTCDLKTYIEKIAKGG